MIGTPVAFPLDTKDDAVNFAIGMIAMVIGKKPEAPPAHPKSTFTLYGTNIDIPTEAIELIMPAAKKYPGSDRDMRSHIDEFLEKTLQGRDPSAQTFKSLDKSTWMHLVTILATCLCRGIFRHPEREAGEPGLSSSGKPLN